MSDRTFNLADLFEIVADGVPGRLALVADLHEPTGARTRQTYAELDARANRVAHHLLAQGVRPGDHVGVLSYNRAEWLESMIGCFKARAAPVNVNYRYVAGELAQLLGDADCVALIGESALLDRVTGIRDRLPMLRHLLAIDDGGPRPSGAVPYEDALAAAAPERDFGPRSPDDPYVIYTGGTTGLPKGVLWRSEDIFFGAMDLGAPLERPDDIAARTHGDPMRFQVMAPLMHGGGQWMTWKALMSAFTVIQGSSRRFDPDATLRLAEREKTQVLLLVGDGMANPIADLLATSPDRYDLSSLFVIGGGGAPLSPPVRAKLKAALPQIGFADTFGGSETGAAGTAVEDADGAPRFAVSEEFAVLDSGLRPIPPGSPEAGVLARSGHIPLRYYKDERKTAETFVTDRDGRRWALQGDHAKVAADGTVILLGRGSLVINTGGEKVFPEEVEAALKEHPVVYDAIVVGTPSERFGQQVSAAMVPEPGRTVTLEELAEHCRDRIAGYKIPRTLRIVDEIKRTPVGKSDYAWARSLFT